jgi:hypothetical protein
MSKFTSLLFSSALIGAVSLAALAPVAVTAQDQLAANKRGQNGPGQHAQRGQDGRPGGFINLVCSPEGAARLETMLSAVPEKTTLTDEQLSLYNAFKASALAAQTEYADTCIAPVRAQNGTGTPDIMNRVKHRQANMVAQVAAMDDIIPTMEAFYDSLTDAQKMDLRPTRGGQAQHQGKGQQRGNGNGPRNNG